MPASAGAASLIIDIVINAGRSGSDLDSLAAKFDKLGSDLVGLGAKVFGGAALVGFFKEAIGAASDLQEAFGGISAVFSGNAVEVRAWASDTSDSIRLPTAAAEQSAAIIGALLKNAGVPMAELSDQTHKLIQRAADVAATYGTTTERAVHAFTSALKGNFNMMDEYGANITALQVKQEAQRIATLNGTDAMDQATRTQATLNLIMGLTADAAGQAEKESGNYAASVERLGETFTNTASDIGNVFLGSATGFNDWLTSSLQAISPLLVGLAELASHILALPAPILALGAAFATMLLFGPKLAASFTGGALVIEGEIEAIKAQMRSLQLQAAAAGTSLGTMGAAGQVAMLRISSGAKSLFAAMGGWVGIIVMAATVLATIGIQQWLDKAAQAKKAADSAKDSVQAFYEVLKNGGKSLGQQAYDNLLKMLADVETGYKTVGEASTASGVDQKTMIDGLIGNGDAAKATLDGIDKKIKELQGTATRTKGPKGESFLVTPEAAKAEIDRLEKLRQGYEAQMPALKGANDLRDEANRIAAMYPDNSGKITADILSEKDAADKLKDALKGAQDAAKNTALDQQMQAAADAVDRVKRSTDYLRDSFDKLSGRPMGIDNSVAAWSKGMTTMKADFADFADKVGSDGAKALNDFDVAAINSTKQGQTLWGDLRTAADDYSSMLGNVWTASQNSGDSMSQSIQKVKDAAGPARQSLLDMIAPLVGGQDQAAALLTKFGIIDTTTLDDKTFQLIMDDDEAARKAKLWETVTFDPIHQQFVTEVPSAVELANQMNTENHLAQFSIQPLQQTTTVIPPTQPAGMSADLWASLQGSAVLLDDIGVPTRVLPPTGGTGPVGAAVTTGAPQTAGTVTAPVTATVAQAQGQLDSLKAPPAVVQVTANTNMANTIISALVNEVRTAKISTSLDTGPAAATINAFVATARVAKISTIADIAPALGTIVSFVNTARNTTIQVQANAGPAMSVINNIIGTAWRATAYIGANADEFYRVWNNLPTSRTITVTVNQVQGSVVAPPATAPHLFAAPSAPGLNAAAMAAPSNQASGSTVNYNVTVTGAITDPDGAARAIQKLLDGRARRSTTVIAR